MKGYRKSRFLVLIASAGILGAALMAVLWAGSARLSATARRAHWKSEYHRPAAIPFPAEDPYSAEEAALGRRLFFDPILSASRSLSCGGCHVPALGWADGKARAIGDNGKVLALRTPTLIDIAWVPVLGWDGKFPDLESVAFAPITSPDNMGLTEVELERRLSASAGYRAAFARAFPDGAISRSHVERALATFERTIVSGETPFDRWIDGDHTAIGAAAKRGFDLFNGRAHCASCHSGWAFTDGSFHDIGSAATGDIGRGRFFPHSVKLRHAFKTPSLRDVALRAPYMHDGSVPTLAAAIELYDRGGIERPSRADAIRPLHLTAAEKSDLLAFLATLSADRPTAMPRGAAR